MRRNSFFCANSPFVVNDLHFLVEFLAEFLQIVEKFVYLQTETEEMV